MKKYIIVAYPEDVCRDARKQYLRAPKMKQSQWAGASSPNITKQEFLKYE